MKPRQIVQIFCLVCALLGAAAAAHAEETAPAKMLVYISPQEYTHSIKLWHYFDDYWFRQGPAVEPVALEVLGAEYGDVKMCEANNAGNTLVWIKPRMYYNPQMGTYYGEITADVFTGSGKAIGTYVGESRKLGFLDVYPERQVETTYRLAMQNLLVKMKADQAIQTAITDGISVGETKSPCAMVAVLPPAKPNDLNYFFKRLSPN